MKGLTIKEKSSFTANCALQLSQFKSFRSDKLPHLEGSPHLFLWWQVLLTMLTTVSLPKHKGTCIPTKNHVMKILYVGKWKQDSTCRNGVNFTQWQTVITEQDARWSPKPCTGHRFLDLPIRSLITILTELPQVLPKRVQHKHNEGSYTKVIFQFTKLVYKMSVLVGRIHFIHFNQYYLVV